MSGSEVSHALAPGSRNGIRFGQHLQVSPGASPGMDGPRLQEGADLVHGPRRVTDMAAVHGDAVRVEGEPRPLSPGVDLSAYRIVQEALTNVVRHAVPATAELTLRYRPCEVVIEVTDNGGTHQKTPSPARTGHGPGHGIAGMRERVAVYGGELVAEPTGSGFRVLARIPTEEAAS